MSDREDPTPGGSSEGPGGEGTHRSRPETAQDRSDALRRGPTREESGSPGLPRRTLIAAGLGLLGACDSNNPRQGFLGLMERWNERVQSSLFDPNQLAPELDASSDTRQEDFPKYFISDSVPIAPPGWTLKVGGRVKRPLSLTLEELIRLPRKDLRVRHHCVEGWSAVASWHGVPLHALAEAVGASPQAKYVEFKSFDAGYWSSWDRPSAFHPQTILAYGMNGDPLSPAHGAPLRLYSAVKLGYKMVKYLTEVNFLDQRTEGYWEVRGYEWFAGV